MSNNEYEYTLSQARLVNVPQSKATEEFLRARLDYDREKWEDYKRRCQVRHEWGIYLCCDFDLDWDTSSYLQRLFALPEEVISPIAPNDTVVLDVRKGDTWNISTGAILPKKILVSYKTATGELKHKTFMPCLSSEDLVPTGELEQYVEARGPSRNTDHPARAPWQTQRSR